MTTDAGAATRGPALGYIPGVPAEPAGTFAPASAGGPLNLPSVQEHRSLRDQVTHALRAALIAGELRPDVIYSAPTLAAQFRVSATPVREAMLDLAKEGLIEVVRNKGFRVTALSPRDLDEYTEIRSLIEVPMAVRIARTADQDALEALRPVAAAIVRAAEARDLIGYLEADRQFHLGLLSLGGNQRLVEVVGDLRKRSRLYGLNGLAARGALIASAREHEEILDLVIARDEAGVERAMSGHLGHIRSLWADHQAERETGGEGDTAPA
ncbi:GntR family transcriptional regulator [Yinghuangia seranimata]|uniref:GntR family transcriptional regulator n=1 Tax=Yinghuangia seranimata TaxID=408067 RepID=UPI00248D15E1|nr:GntR family transcriptional regulator [Yinghuangia seranimata]MDI2132055.1 GntR family transcriptional regulator [Yinghuangia seranimata]